jgi:hypothetical protein
VRNTHKSMRSPSTSNFVGLPLSRKSIISFIRVSSLIDDLVAMSLYQKTESKVKKKTQDMGRFLKPSWGRPDREAFAMG